MRPLGLNTANLHTSIFDALKKADGDYIFSCCDLLWFPALVSARPHYGEVWVPKYDNISFWCSIAVFKSLIGALQLTSIYKYFWCINLLNQMWFRALMSAPLYKGEEGNPSRTRNSESACSTFCALISYFYHIFFCANKTYFYDVFSSGFSVFLYQTGNSGHHS